MKIKTTLRWMIWIPLIALFVIVLFVFLPNSDHLFTGDTKVMGEHKMLKTTAQTKEDRVVAKEPGGKDSIEKRMESLEVDEPAFVDVSVATLWTEPDLNRAIDEASVDNPVDMWKWTEGMTLEEKEGLVGNLQTQALYGGVVTIIDIQDDWAQVAVHEQPDPDSDEGYEAWMPMEQLIYESMFDHLAEENPFIVVTEPTAWIYSDEEMQSEFLEVSYNTRLPVIKQVDEQVLIATPGDGDKWIAEDSVAIYNQDEDIPEPTGDTLVKSGEQFLGLPYLWAGTSGFGFDCSGFTYSLFQANGVTIPRDSSVQATHGTAVDKGDLQKGDLLFFADQNGNGFVHHVGMYIGDGEMIHAPDSDTTVKIINVFESDYWSSEYSGARRYID